MSHTWIKYALKRHIPLYEACGWVFSYPVSEYAVAVEWPFDSEPVYPDLIDAAQSEVYK